MESERKTEEAFLDLAYEMGLPLVATNEAFFPARDDYEAHDALICISEGRGSDRKRPAAVNAGALFQDARRNVRSFC
jgi:DNA polymerase-3 subunit alpha